MDESKIKFGDKLFVYGQYLSLAEEFNEYEYNSVFGYMTVGELAVSAVETPDATAVVPGFVVDFGQQRSLDGTWLTPFARMDMVDVTDKLSRSLPLPSGTKVWMPTTQSQPVRWATQETQPSPGTY